MRNVCTSLILLGTSLPAAHASTSDQWQDLGVANGYSQSFAYGLGDSGNSSQARNVPAGCGLWWPAPRLLQVHAAGSLRAGLTA